jgi:hypothetical protein
MLIGDTIGSFTQIECSELPEKGALSGHESVRLLVIDADQPGQIFISVQAPKKTVKKPLLCILHSSWLNPDNPRCLQRFRYGYYPYGSFRTGFEDVRLAQFAPKAGIGNQVVTGRRYLLEATGPSSAVILLVRGVSFRYCTRTMPRDKLTVLNHMIQLGEHSPE